MRNMKFKAFKMESFDAETGIVEGYASTYGNADKVNDVVVRGAFKQAVLHGPERVRFLWEHKRTEVIGMIREMREDERGLWIKAEFGPTQRAQETRDLMKMGAVDSFSIGYRVIQEKKGRLGQKSVNYLQEVELLEVSCVAWPCNVEARMTAIKSDIEDRIDGLNLEQQAIVHKFIDFLEAEQKEEPVVIEATPEQVSQDDLQERTVLTENAVFVIVNKKSEEKSEDLEDLTVLAAELEMLALAQQLQSLL